MVIRSLLKFTLRASAILVSLILLYLIAAFALPFITVNNNSSIGEKNIRIFVSSNGVHTDVILPVTTVYKDWSLSFPRDSFHMPPLSRSFMSFGWGDQGFYFKAKTWADLTFPTAFNAAFGLSRSAMHIGYKKEPQAGEDCVELLLDEQQYQMLIRFIEDSFQKQDENPVPIPQPGYGRYDRFYEAKGTYTLFRTCNVWTNEALKACGARTPCWSPFPGGLMRALKP